VKLSSLFLLMPPEGTYAEIDAQGWTRAMKDDYKADDEQARDAVSSLRRCGAAYLSVRDPFQSGQHRQTFITVQKPPLSTIISVGFSAYEP
jgi:hypothetical protein